MALRDEKLDPLPEAEREVRSLGQLYNPARSRVYIGADAREDRVKSEAGQARILHFATQGMIGLTWALFIGGVPCRRETIRVITSLLRPHLRVFRIS